MIPVIGPAMRQIDIFHGEPIQWFRYVGMCPCHDSKNGTYNRSHTLCGGTGKLKEEVDVSAFLAIVTNVTVSKVYHGLGELVAGDLICATWPQEIPLARYDEVVVPSRNRAESAQIVRGSGIDPIPLPTTAVVAAVNLIQRIYDNNGPIYAGYSLQSDGIAWKAGTGPTLGARYTVRYRYSPRWEVIDDAILNRVPDPNGDPIAQKVALRLITPPR